MNARRLKLIILLAIAVALSPVQGTLGACPVHDPNGGGVHHHEHDHGGGSHYRTHVHEDHLDDDAHDRHCILDHGPDSPSTHRSTSTRTAEVDPSPTLSSPPVVAMPSPADRAPYRRAKRPPGSSAHLRQLSSLKTVVLRL